MQLGLRRVIVGDKHVLSSNARAQVGFGDAKVLAKSEELIKRQAKEVYKKKIGVNFRRMKFNTLVEATAQLENMEYLERFLEDLKKLTTGMTDIQLTLSMRCCEFFLCRARVSSSLRQEFELAATLEQNRRSYCEGTGSGDQGWRI